MSQTEEEKKGFKTYTAQKLWCRARTVQLNDRAARTQKLPQKLEKIHYQWSLLDQAWMIHQGTAAWWTELCPISVLVLISPGKSADFYLYLFISLPADCTVASKLTFFYLLPSSLSKVSLSSACVICLFKAPSAIFSSVAAKSHKVTEQQHVF